MPSAKELLKGLRLFIFLLFFFLFFFIFLSLLPNSGLFGVLYL